MLFRILESMNKLWVCLLSALFFLGVNRISAQSLGNAGTIQGVVIDQSGAAVAGAEVSVHNSISGYSQTTTSAADGSFRLSNIPPNPYHIEAKAAKFSTYSQEISIRNAIPIQVKATLAVAGTQTTITVEAAAAEALENDPSAHVDVDRTQMMRIPSFDPGGGLSQAITYSTGGVAADGNGLFHPLGDHAQASFIIDGQPISDQQSKVFSTQLPTSAIQVWKSPPERRARNSATKPAWSRRSQPAPDLER